MLYVYTISSALEMTAGTLIYGHRATHADQCASCNAVSPHKELYDTIRNDQRL